jgi:hypothetical protein
MNGLRWSINFENPRLANGLRKPRRPLPGNPLVGFDTVAPVNHQAGACRVGRPYCGMRLSRPIDDNAKRGNWLWPDNDCSAGLASRCRCSIPARRTSIFTQDVRFTGFEPTIEDGSLKDPLAESIGYTNRGKDNTGKIPAPQGNSAIDHLVTAIGALHS